MGRRAPKRVDGLLDLFNPASSTDARRKELDSRGARFTGRVSNPSIGESEHASSVVDVTAGTTRAGEGAGRVRRSSAGCDRGARGAGRAAPPGVGAHLASADVRGGLRVAWRPMVVLGDDSTARGVGCSSGARSRSFRSREGGARGRRGVAIRGRVDDRREASARSDASMPAGERAGGARRCERGERGARATRPGGRSGSIDPRASNRHAIKQGISSGVD